MLWNKKVTCLFAAASIAALLLSGCTNERLEKELSYRQIGINSIQSGDYEGAVAAFDNALAQCTGKITETEKDICYYKAAAQYAGGDLKGALLTYQALLDYNSKDGNAYYLRGCINLQLEDTKNALSDYENAVKYNPDDYELYINIYENLSGYNLLEDGKEYLNKAFDIKGNGAKHLAYRGKIYYLLGEYDNAEKELKAALEKKSVAADLYLGQVYEARGDMESAEKHYQAYAASGEADAETMNALAEIEMARGSYSTALTYIQQGFDMEDVPNRQELMQNAIISYEYTGDFASAWATIQEYVKLYPGDSSAQREYIFLKNRQMKEEAAAPEAGNPEDVPSTEGVPEETEG